MIEVREKSSVCGEGTFATRDIPYDSVLLVESPLFVINVYEKTRCSKEDVYNALCSLDEEGRKTFRSLFGRTDMEKWTQNHFYIRHSNKRHEAKPFGIYPHSAKLNHSCVPNAERVYNNDYTVSLINITPIKKGDEVTISYLNNHELFYKRESRQELLRNKGIFTTRNRCVCPACESHTEMRDTNRGNIKEYLLDNSLASSSAVWSLLREEGISARLLDPSEVLILVFPKGSTVRLGEGVGIVEGQDLFSMKVKVKVGETSHVVSHEELSPC